MANANASPVVLRWLEGVLSNPNETRSVEDLLAIQEHLEDEVRALEQTQRERVIAETDTRDERVQRAAVEPEIEVSEEPGSAFLSWFAPSSPMVDAVAMVVA